MSGTTKQTVELVCVICGKAFLGRNPQKYCSKTCSNRAAQLREKRRNGGSTVTKTDAGYAAGCKRCAYRSDLGYCDYIGHHEQCRPCVPYKGGGCDLYTPKLPQWPAPRPWDERRARRLWLDGEDYHSMPRERMEELTRELAKKLGCAPNSVKAWLNHGGAEDGR